MLGWMKHKLESRLPGEISVISDMQMIPPMAESEDKLKASWGEWKRQLKTQHSKNEDHGTQFHCSMQIGRENMETVTGFIILGFKITAEVTEAMKLKVTCSLEEKLSPA